MNFGDLLKLQWSLQFQIPPKGRDVRDLTEDERAEFIRWNMLALMDELHEALAEVGWKPWATNREIDHIRFRQEMADALHFFLNLLIVGCGERDLEMLGEMFEDEYLAKRARNIERHLTGEYDGVSSKCAWCHRDLDELPVSQKLLKVRSSTGLEYCNRDHCESHERGEG